MSCIGVPGRGVSRVKVDPLHMGAGYFEQVDSLADRRLNTGGSLPRVLLHAVTHEVSSRRPAMDTRSMCSSYSSCAYRVLREKVSAQPDEQEAALFQLLFLVEAPTAVATREFLDTTRNEIRRAERRGEKR